MAFEKKIFKLSSRRIKNLPSLRQLKYLKRLLSQKEKKIIFFLFWLSLISLLGILLSLYFKNSEVQPAYGGIYKEGLVGQPKFINPLLANNDIDLTISNLIFSSLFKYDENNELQPDLANTLPSEINENNKTICLKPNLLWHDGEKLTTADLVFTLELIKKMGPKSLFFEKLKNTQFSIIDKNCFSFQNAELSDLCFGILPQHIWQTLEPIKINQSLYNLKPIGTGPFQFVSLESNKEDGIKNYKLKQNKNYYNQIPYIEQIIFKFYQNFTQAIQALEKKEINGLGHIPQNFKEKVIGFKKIKYYPLNLPYYTAAFFNLNNSLLKDKNVRHALALLTPKEEILNTILGQDGLIMDGPLLPTSKLINPNIKKYEYNPQLAQEILKNAGWENNKKGFLEKNGDILELSLTTIKETDFSKIATLLQQSWQKANIKIKLISIPAEQIQEVIKTRNFQIFLYGILQKVDFNPYFFWHSSQKIFPGLNLTGFNNRRVDELLEKAYYLKDTDMKKKYYDEFQEIIAANIPAIFLYNATYGYFINEKIKGISISQIDHPKDRFRNIENWYIKTKRQFKKK
ncbi:hypothetical protein B6D52_02090 [Candidatus Parcubacteria bacterium 4484_255]|nr:MAG: hypothetical protein B6D52_02090 [Candidatus Parcubacteria bacterium 4484_255]